MKTKKNYLQTRKNTALNGSLKELFASGSGYLGPKRKRLSADYVFRSSVGKISEVQADIENLQQSLNELPGKTFIVVGIQNSVVPGYKESVLLSKPQKESYTEARSIPFLVKGIKASTKKHFRSFVELLYEDDDEIEKHVLFVLYFCDDQLQQLLESESLRETFLYLIGFAIMEDFEQLDDLSYGVSFLFHLTRY
jgi:hypothetical protein